MLHTERYTLNTARFKLHSTQYTLHSTRYTVHSTPYTIHTKHYTLTVHSTHYTLHFTHYTLKFNTQKRSFSFLVLKWYDKPKFLLDVFGMKTKGFASGVGPVTRPKEQFHPRLTQSYLDEYHNSTAGSPNNSAAAAIHDWQFNKYQQGLSLKDDPPHSLSPCSKRASSPDSVKCKGVHFRDHTRLPFSDDPYFERQQHDGYTRQPNGSSAYYSGDNRFLKEDCLRGRGPATPYPNKMGEY